jgi:hypothetical protein
MIKKTLAEFWDEFNPIEVALAMNSDYYKIQSRFDVVYSKFKNDIFTLRFARYDDDYDGYEMCLNFIEEGKKC